MPSGNEFLNEIEYFLESEANPLINEPGAHFPTNEFGFSNSNIGSRFSSGIADKIRSVRVLLDEYRLKHSAPATPATSQFSLIRKMDFLRMIYRTTGATMRQIIRSKPTRTILDCVSFPIIRAVHWKSSQCMEALLPSYIPPVVRADQPVHFERLARMGGRDIGDILTTRAPLTGHGITTDLRDDLRSPDDPHISTIWLSEDQAAAHRLTISDGKLSALDGSVYFDSTGMDPAHTTANFQGRLVLDDEIVDMQSAGYVMDLHGKIYAAEHGAGEDQVFYHSSYLAGKDVLCGGRIFVQNGILFGIDNASGHYKPSTENLRNAVRELKRQGVRLNQTMVLDMAAPDFDRMMAMLPTTKNPWETAEDFLNLQVRELLQAAKVTEYFVPLRTAVNRYRTQSTGRFRKPSRETRTALALLQGIEAQQSSFVATCLYYAYYPQQRDDQNIFLRNCAAYAQRTCLVKPMPLDNSKERHLFRTRYKSGFRRKLLETFGDQGLNQFL